MCGLVGLTLRSKRKVLGSWLVTFRLNLKENKDVSKFLSLTTFESFNRSSTARMILQKGALKTSSKFTGEALIKYSSIIPCGDSHKEKAEAVNKLLKHISIRENVDFAFNNNINVKRHLNRIYI